MKTFLNVGVLLLLMTPVAVIAQDTNNQKDRDLKQISGVVIKGDSLSPIPFVNIVIKNTHRGTTADYFGYFSLVAKEQDTIVFSSVGYRRAMFIVPDTLSDDRYVLMQSLSPDTVQLQETVIYPWPTKEEFRNAFLNLKVPDDDMARAERNLNREAMAARYEVTPMDGSMNHTLYMQQEASKLYYAGQLPPNNLLNPLAWMKFIDAWKRGDFKRKKE
ncbi:MAG: carboxypeptidase-like regulatory domain-containing protein [Flavobacteriales bacterium]|nr:carboxypeptidase-like regulatory domain-containing protein [Flavobacteriales bacterium]